MARTTKQDAAPEYSKKLQCDETLQGQSNKEREQRMEETPAYKKAMKHRNDDSAVHKAQVRTFQAMGAFFQEVTHRHQPKEFKTKIFTNTDFLTAECNAFLQYCMVHELVPSWMLLSVWLGCNVDTMNAILCLGTDDPRSAILQKAKSAIYTILEQFTVSAEGNPGGRIFLMKSLWGLSDQPNSIDVNIHTDESHTTLPPDSVEKIVNLAPDDYSEKAQDGAKDSDDSGE